MYYTSDERLKQIIDYFRENSDAPLVLERILEDLPMSRKTGWKGLQVLIGEGIVRKEESRSPTGHMRYEYMISWWELMTDEVKDEIIGLLEEIVGEIRKRNGVNTTYYIENATIINGGDGDADKRVDP